MARASDILAVARAELGVKEHPAGSNHVKYNTAYYGREVRDTKDAKYPWCAVFVWWCFRRAGAAALLPIHTASCGSLMRAAQRDGMWVTDGYKPGDVVIYDLPGGGSTDHCGIVDAVECGSVIAIEGNTGAGNDANGGEVQRRTRSIKLIRGAVRPRYDTEEKYMDIEKLTEAQLIRLAERMQAALAKRPISATLAEELEEAKSMGITDGSNPSAFCTRAQCAAMVKRAVE